MPLSLYLLRHAQSADKQSGQFDYDRKLTSAGESDAKIIGNYLLKHHHKIDSIVCSTAVRTKQTGEIVQSFLEIPDEKIIFLEALYHGRVDTYLDIIKEFTDAHVMIIGHNPSISLLAQELCSEAVKGLTPCSLVKVNFENDLWSTIMPGSGKLDLMIDPAFSHL